MLYSGIDLHKRTSTITTLTPAGDVVRRAKVGNSPDALAAYFRQLPGPHCATAEATGSWYWLADLLTAEGVTLTLAHAKFLKAIAYAKVKTDAVDSLTLAQLLRADLIPEAHMISPELRPLRDLLRTRLRLVQKEVGTRNSIQRLLEKYNVPEPDALPPMAQLEAALHREQVDLLRSHIRRIEKELNPLLIPNPDVQRLLAIPGIGRLTAFTIVLEVDDVARFPTDRHFVSYCRLVPGAADSGGRQRHRRSKDGNRYLKLAFSHAGVRARQYYPVIRAFYDEKARTKNRQIARALVAKELARIAYVVLKRGAEFDNTFKGNALQHEKKREWPRRRSPGV